MVQASTWTKPYTKFDIDFAQADACARVGELEQLPKEDQEHIYYTLDNLIKAAMFKAIK